MRKPFLSIAAALLLYCSACDQHRIADVFLPVEAQQWYYDDVKRMEFDMSDTSSLCNILVNIRHAGNYEWQNLYIRLRITSPSGETASELLSLPLATTAGKWMGKGLGDVYELQVPYKEGIQFRERGQYVFELEQHMRVNPLVGIHHMGIRIEKQP
jgi:gliding motility-associated lipoprotein GldH